MTIRGVRGATTIRIDKKNNVLEATQELLVTIMVANPTMVVDDIGSCFFSVTEDIKSAFPAEAARNIGWKLVPLMCAKEIDVPGGLKRCIRVLIHWNTDLPQGTIRHIYLRNAKSLRPDISQEENTC